VEDGGEESRRRWRSGEGCKGGEVAGGDDKNMGGVRGGEERRGGEESRGDGRGRKGKREQEVGGVVSA